jgi:uncharacterized membrane protein (DUF485 family)
MNEQGCRGEVLEAARKEEELMLEHSIQPQPGEVFADPTLVRGSSRAQALIRRSRSFGFGLSITMMIIYVGFFALVAFAPDMLGAGNVLFGSVGYLVVFLMFVIAWGLTWFYLRQTASVLEPMAAAARTEIHASMTVQAGRR